MLESAKKIKEVSAADILKKRMDRPVKRDLRPQGLPEVGSIILYNELNLYSDINGRRCRGQRGIAVVSGYTSQLMLVRVMKKPSLHTGTSFRIADVRVGLLQYKILSEPLFMGVKGEPGAFCYEDLSIENPHVDIARLIVKR